MENTAKGLENLKKYVDTLIIIPNDKIKTVVAKNTPMREALRVADEILKQGIKGIAELIVNPSLINLDFADVRTILKDKGIAHLGVGEVADAAELVRSVVDASANIIFGARIDPNVRDEVEITVIATGFPGFDSRREEDSTLRGYQNGRIYADRSYSSPQPDRMTVSEPYYARQPIQPTPVQQQVPPVQPPVPVPPQPLVRTVDRDEGGIERPNDKNVPKFAQLLKNFGKKRDN